MQEKRKRAAHEIHADSCATHTTNSSISTGNGCACTSAEQKKRHSAPDWGPPRPQDDRHHANATAVHPVELLSASEVRTRPLKSPSAVYTNASVVYMTLRICCLRPAMDVTNRRQ